jgi:hypothetical protein
MLPVDAASAARIAAPLPRLTGWRIARSTSPAASRRSNTSRVPSVEQSSTQMISLATGTERIIWMMLSIVSRSL